MLNIHVTQDDIDNGQPCMVGRCPIAFAVSRVMNKPCTIGCYTATVYSRDGKKILRTYKHNGYQFVTAFDRHEHVEPCTITLRLDDL